MRSSQRRIELKCTEFEVLETQEVSVRESKCLWEYLLEA